MEGGCEIALGQQHADKEIEPVVVAIVADVEQHALAANVEEALPARLIVRAQPFARGPDARVAIVGDAKANHISPSSRKTGSGCEVAISLPSGSATKATRCARSTARAGSGRSAPGRHRR